MTTQIIPGIYEMQVPIPNNPLGNTNVYLVKGRAGHTLIDTGWSSDQAMQALTRELEEIGVGFKDISQIIVTHAHIDHYGLVEAIKPLTHARVFLHHRDEEIFRTRYAVTEEFMRRSEEWFRINGVPAPESGGVRMPFGGFRASGMPPKPDVLLHGGESLTTGIFELRIIWTPGHSPGHICLYDSKNKLFFAGDHILPVITPNISLPPNSDGNPLGDFLNSLKELKKLDVKIVLPAHENVFYDLPKRIDEILHHHQVRKNEILRSLDTESLTAYQLSNQITWMPELGGVKFQDLMPGDKRAAVSETLAHLRAMETDGELSKTRQNDTILYHRA